MTRHYMDLMFTDAVKAQQELHGSRNAYSHDEGTSHEADRFGQSEAFFISQRDSFYMATVGENGWPYVQHRGGPSGFVQVLDDSTLAIPDYRGNRQYISVGNSKSENRASLFFMDYLNKQRLKVLVYIETQQLDDNPELAQKVEKSGLAARTERMILFKLEAFEWNCPQYITERYTLKDVQNVTDQFQNRILELEAEVKRLGGEQTPE